jgi:hypothetical protein
VSTVFVAGTSYYGDTGTTLATEDRKPTPTGWGSYLAPAVKVVEEFIQTGLPTVLLEWYMDLNHGLCYSFLSHSIQEKHIRIKWL